MKKGFTLIELLAVIVILAVIVLVAIPLLNKLIDNARMNSIKDSVYGIWMYQILKIMQKNLLKQVLIIEIMKKANNTFAFLF